MDIAPVYRIAVALGFGILIGLAHERRRGARPSPVAGACLFGLLALLGAGAALLSHYAAGPWPLAGAMAVAGSLTVADGLTMTGGRLAPRHQPTQRQDPVTAAAGLLTLLLGALCAAGPVIPGGVLAVLASVLLAMQAQVERVAERITRTDVEATLKFALVAVVVQPLLPNRSFFPAPFDVLNPAKIGWMMVLIAAVGYAGYLLMRLLDANRGLKLTGALGGLTSSTAVTLTFAGQSRRTPALGAVLAPAILLAWSIMFPRVLLIAWSSSRALGADLWLPLLASTAVGLGCAWLLHRRGSSHDDGGAVSAAESGFRLAPALKFGLLYAVLLVVARVAQMHYGNTGVYLSAIATGAAQLDAITLSMASLTNSGDVAPHVASQAIVLATISNTIVKAGIVACAGAGPVRKALPAVPLMLAAALGALWLA